MTNQSQSELTINPRQSTMQVIAARIKVIRLLSVTAVTLFLFAGTVHADILVSNFDLSTVYKYYDDGTHGFSFLPGATSAEGVQCVKLLRNKVYVSSAGGQHSDTIRAYDLTTGAYLPGEDITINGAHRIIAMAMNADASVLYAADDQSGNIFAVRLPVNSSAPCNPSGDCKATTPSSLDVVVGPDGNVYATNRFSSTPLGVRQFLPVPPSGTWNPGAGVLVIPPTSPSYNGRSLAHAGAMIFDGSNNLWVNNTTGGNDDGIFEFTGPSPNPNPFKVLNWTTDSGAYPLGMDISPTNPPAPPFDPCRGCIVVAEFHGKATPQNPAQIYGDVDQIDPHSCNGTIYTLGTCHFYASTPFIPPVSTTMLARPKYVRFIENCNDTGYVEICKMSCLTNPVHGYFDFTATNAGTSIGPVHIPVNACSGPIQIPNGTVTIHETQQLGIEVTNITAYDYDYQGYQINALLSFNLPFQTGNVDVVSGDVSTETVAGFTNCASGPGELKICKVAGQGVMVGTLFSFTASGDPMRYQVPAGPPPGGYCVVGMSYPVGTPVLVTELPQPGYVVSSIMVAPPDRGGTQTSNSVIAIIDSGTTEVTFTNVPTGKDVRCLACPN